MKTPAWDAWKGHAAPDLSGEWRFVGHEPGHGDYQGKVTIASQGKDKYAYKLHFAYADGTEMDGTGNGIVYTGYEWRSRTTVGDQASLEVFEVVRGRQPHDRPDLRPRPPMRSAARSRSCASRAARSWRWTRPT